MAARKQYPLEQKLQIVKETMETGNASIVGRRYDVAPSLISRWVRTYKKHGTLTPTSQEKGEAIMISCSPKEHKAVIQENEKLKKLLGEKDLEIAILRDLLKKTNPHLMIK